MLETSVSDELSSSEKEVANTEDVENKIKVITAMGQSKIIDLFLKGLILILEQKRVPCLKPERVVYLQDLDVSEKLRSGGIGAKLIEACKEYGKARGADFMRTQVFPQIVRGMQFYERQGFSEKMKTIEVYL